jgi:hypothetical protein
MRNYKHIIRARIHVKTFDSEIIVLILHRIAEHIDRVDVGARDKHTTAIQNARVCRKRTDFGGRQQRVIITITVIIMIIIIFRVGVRE